MGDVGWVDAAVERLQAECERLREERDVLSANAAEAEEAVRLYWGERDRLRAALFVAADDLDKAANQFEGLREFLRKVPGRGGGENVRIFTEKAARAREALEESK
jgi:hypothetical protein